MWNKRARRRHAIQGVALAIAGALTGSRAVAAGIVAQCSEWGNLSSRRTVPHYGIMARSGTPLARPAYGAGQRACQRGDVG